MSVSSEQPSHRMKPQTPLLLLVSVGTKTHGKMIRNCVTSLDDILSHVCNIMTGGLRDSRFHVSREGDRRQEKGEGNEEKFKNCSYVNADEYFSNTF